MNFVICAYLLMSFIYLGAALSMPWMARLFHNDRISIVLGCSVIAGAVTFYFSFHARRLHDLALSSNGVLLVYHQVTTWLPLYPWNDVEEYSRNDLLLEAGMNGLLMGLISLLCLMQGNSGFYHWYPLL